MNIKDFLKTWTNKKALKEMSKDERCNDVYQSLDTILNFFLFRRYKEKENLEKLYDVFASPKFVKTLNKVVKDAKGEWAPDASICIVISSFIKVRGQDIDQEIIDKYKKIIKILTKKLLNKLKNIDSINELAAMSIVSVIPSKHILNNKKYAHIYVSNLEKALYSSAILVDSDENFAGLVVEDFTDKTVASLVKLLFEKEYKNAILLAIALDKKIEMANFSNRQLSVWNAFTYYLTEQLESMDKSEIEKFLEAYVEQRSKDAKENKDSARRINFSQLQVEDNKKIVKVVNKLIEKDKQGKYKRYL